MSHRIRTWGRTVSGTVLAFAVSLHTTSAAPAQPSAPHKVGLGKVLSTKDGGQIYGFDIDQNGDDGVLASAGYDSGGNFFVSVETFDQNKGTITKSLLPKTAPEIPMAWMGSLLATLV